MTVSSASVPTHPLLVGGGVTLEADGLPRLKVEGQGRRLVVHVESLRDLWTLRRLGDGGEGPLAAVLRRVDLALDIRIEGRTVAHGQPGRRPRPRWGGVILSLRPWRRRAS